MSGSSASPNACSRIIATDEAQEAFAVSRHTTAETLFLNRCYVPALVLESIFQSGAISTLTACSGCRGHGQLRRSLPGTDFKARRSWTVCAEMPTPGATSTFISSGKPNSAVSSPATEFTLWRMPFCPAYGCPVVNPQHRRAPGCGDLDPGALSPLGALRGNPVGGTAVRAKLLHVALLQHAREVGHSQE